MARHFILMADVVGSRKLPGLELARDLGALVERVQSVCRICILSPMTITLGDEFQGVVRTLKSAVRVIYEFEKIIFEENYNFKLHYVLNEGEIETEINEEVSYGMLGSGLTQARDLLSSKKRDRRRFTVKLLNERNAQQLNLLFQALENLTDKWSKRNAKIIVNMISNPSDQLVADHFGVDRSQIWKRRKTLRIDDYHIFWRLIFDLTSRPLSRNQMAAMLATAGSSSLAQIKKQGIPPEILGQLTTEKEKDLDLSASRIIEKILGIEIYS